MKHITAYNITEFINEMLSPLDYIEGFATDMVHTDDERYRGAMLRQIQKCIEEIRNIAN